jgi:hypothetical protein
MTMKIHVYSLCWNEERFLPYFLRHYCPIAEKIAIYDNLSEDRSVEIIKSFPNTQVRPYSTAGQLRDDAFLYIKNQTWKESRGQADWVIIVDTDELLWHANLLGYLEECKQKGVSIPVPIGYEMISDAFPSAEGQVYEEIKRGTLFHEYSKLCIFNPDLIQDINYGPGCHLAAPQGQVVVDQRGDLKLLHYRFLGLDYVLPRFEARRSRMSELNKAKRWGAQYEYSQEQIIGFINSFKSRMTQVIP